MCFGCRSIVRAVRSRISVRAIRSHADVYEHSHSATATVGSRLGSLAQQKALHLSIPHKTPHNPGNKTTPTTTPLGSIPRPNTSGGVASSAAVENGSQTGSESRNGPQGGSHSVSAGGGISERLRSLIPARMETPTLNSPLM